MNIYVHPILNFELYKVSNLFDKKITILRLNKKKNCFEIQDIDQEISEILSVNISLVQDLFTEYIIIRKNSIKLPLYFVDVMRSLYIGEEKRADKDFIDIASCLGFYDPKSNNLTNAGENYLFIKYKGLCDNAKDIRISKKHMMIIEKMINPVHESFLKEKENIEDYEYLMYHNMIKKEGDYFFITRKSQEYLTKRKYKKSCYIYKYDDIIPYIKVNSGITYWNDK